MNCGAEQHHNSQTLIAKTRSTQAVNAPAPRPPDLEAPGSCASCLGSLLEQSRLPTRCSALVGEGVSQLLGLAGGEEVPSNLAVLSQESLEAIGNVVEQTVRAVLDNEKLIDLDALSLVYREYVRDVQDLEGSRAILLNQINGRATTLLQFFKQAGLATNQAFQLVVGLRLGLQAELRAVDLARGASDLAAATEANMRVQAADAKSTLEKWRAEWEPVTNTVRVTTRGECNRRPSGVCDGEKTGVGAKFTTKVCMVMESPGLEKLDEFCKPKVCASRKIIGRQRKKANKKCREDFERKEVPVVRRHAREVAIGDFQELNDGAVFGPDVDSLLATLQKIVEGSFGGEIVAA